MTDKPLGKATGKPCPKCNAELVWRRGRYSVFQGCSKFPQCDGKIGAPRGKYASKAEGEEAPKPVEEKPPRLICGVVGCYELVFQPHQAGVYCVNHECALSGCTKRRCGSESYCLVHEVMRSEEGKPMETPEVVETKVVAQTEAGNALWQLIAPLALQACKGIAESAAKEAAKDIKGGALNITWTLDTKPFAKLEGEVSHKALNDALKRVKAGLKNLLIVGPAGSGKTTLAAQAARAMGLPFGAVSCTSGMPEWHLTGRSTPNLQTGENVYAPSLLVKMYEAGGVFLIDEIDAADPNVMLVINSAIANGHWHVQGMDRVLTRHPDFVLVAAANTYGTGANRQYVGRNQLDASTLSRFACATIEVDYDRDLENSLISDARVLSQVWKMRDRVVSLGLRRVVGTRELIAVARLVHSGESLDMAVDALTVGWTPDEVSKVCN